MMKITAFGNATTGHGLSYAYRTHTEALKTFVDVEVQAFETQTVAHASNVYVHGLPNQTQHVLDAQGAKIFGKGRSIAYWVWETTKLDESFTKFKPYFTEFWTCSKWCQEVMRESGFETKCVPHFVTSFGLHEKCREVFQVVCVLDGGSRILRKNPFDVVRVFKSAFTKTDPARLVFKLKNVGPSVVKWIRQEMQGYDCIILEKFIEQEQLQELIGESHCLLSMHRAEGFGLHLLEAMALGTPVVATGWSGNMEFMTKENSLPVDYVLDDVDDGFYSGQWAYPILDDAVDKLRSLASDPALALRLREAGFNTALEFSFSKGIRDTRKAFE